MIAIYNFKIVLVILCIIVPPTYGQHGREVFSSPAVLFGISVGAFIIIAILAAVINIVFTKRYIKPDNKLAYINPKLYLMDKLVRNNEQRLDKMNNEKRLDNLEIV
ncbi:hypothetical protein GJ496_008539 [Pomphorhynchus laevis]|nr:hypothetical protein GJ496_008539 [Pomphorhynchus laevis]